MSATRPRRLFVAGSTGVTGRAFVSLCESRGVPFVPHVRPRHQPHSPAAAVFELADAEKLRAALAGCTTVVQLIGTMRKRFSAGDTYESSDIGTTRQLADAARAAGTIDHFLLLTAIGAGKPRGAYLRAKAEAERIVTGSGIAYTIFRPSFLAGEDRCPPPGSDLVLRMLGLTRYRPITVDQLAAGMLRCALERAPLGVALEGDSLRGHT